MPKVPSHRHPALEERLSKLESQYRKLEQFLRKPRQPVIHVYSADAEVCVGMHSREWHRIVCQYEGTRCIGSPRPHWRSEWEYGEKGFSLSAFLDHEWKGWHGQYAAGEMRYDELPRDILKLHNDAMLNHLKTFSTWLPCHIYNDFTGDMYRP